jgi:MFS family permease
MRSLLKPHLMGILLLLISFGTLSAVILTPALPGLSLEFGVSEAKAQLTMSIFLIGYTLGQLPYGPVANRFGRKKTIYIGIGLMIIGSFLAISASSFSVLILSRFIQALGAAVGLKITFTMISDQHIGQAATKAISILSLAFAVMPAIGVTIGGYIVEFWGWRGNFVFLSFYAVLLALLVLFLPETSKELDRGALQIKKIARGYLNQFKNSTIVFNAMFMGLMSSTFYLFATLSPYVGILHIGLAPAQFGLWNMILCVGLFFGVFFTQWFSRKNKPRLAILIGILLMAFPAAAMALCFSFSWVNVWTLFIPAAMMRFGSNAIWSNASSTALEISHDKSNTSAVMQFINLSLATSALFLVSAVSPSQIMLLPSALGGIVILLFSIWVKTR